MTREQDIPFGSRLRRLREAAGLTQEELGARAGLTAKAISLLERGRRKRPYPHTVTSLADALELSEEERAVLTGAIPSRTTGDAPVPVQKAATVSPSSLPASLTPLLGREREVKEVVGLLDQLSAVRLLTLTGPGGIGKTRLGIEAARKAGGYYFPDGVAFVALAPLADAALVMPTVSQVLGLREAAGVPSLEVLCRHLRERKFLLVLDNFEHVAEAAPEVAELLGSCPSLSVLVTSRAPLRVRGEREYPVSPLAVPDPTRMPEAEEVAQTPAAELFIERTRAASPAFEVTSENAATVAAICWRLDGLPLALELAAARTRFLGPTALLSRLDRALQAGGARDLPERQRTMRSTLDWSYELLHEPERALFRRLSVFAGGFTLEAAEEVCASGVVEAEEVLLLLGNLVEQSLVLAKSNEKGDGIRYRMLEPVRQYALGKLEECGEAEEARRRHAAWSLALAEEAEPKLKGPEQETWLELLEAEHHNLRAALQWSLGEGDAGLGLRVAAALWSFWFMHGYLGEGRSWLESGLSRSSLAAGPTSAKALNGAGYIALRQGEYGAAKGLLERSLALYRELQDSEGIVSSLANLGLVALLGQREDIPVADLLEEALGLRPQLKDRHTVASLLAFAGVVAGTRRDWKRAAALHEESLALFRAAGDARGIVSTLNTLGLIQLVQADYDGASALFRESLRLGLEIDHKQIILYSFFGLAGVATGQELPARAARLWGVAEGMSEAYGIVVSPIVRLHTKYEDCLTTTRSQLDEEAFEAAWAEGRAMTLEQAVEYALEGAGGPDPKAP